MDTKFQIQLEVIEGENLWSNGPAEEATTELGTGLAVTTDEIAELDATERFVCELPIWGK